MSNPTVQPTFDFASFMSSGAAGTPNGQSQSNDNKDSAFNNSSNKRSRPSENIQNLQNPNVANLRSASANSLTNNNRINNSNPENLESIIVGLDGLNMQASDKQKLEHMAQIHDKIRTEKEREKQIADEKKAARAALEKKLKQDDNYILQIMIKYAEKYSKPDLQLKPRADAETTFGIDWGEKKQRKMDLDYAQEYFKDLMFIEKRPFRTPQEVENELERMFSEEERIRRCKSKPKPKLLALAEKDIDPYKLIPFDEVMKCT